MLRNCFANAYLFPFALVFLDMVKRDDDASLKKYLNLDNSIVDTKSNTSNCNLLHVSVLHNSRSCLKLLLEISAHLINEADDDGDTPLMYAVIFDNTDMVSMMLQYEEYINIHTKDGGTLLDLAKDNPEMMQLFHNLPKKM